MRARESSLGSVDERRIRAENPIGMIDVVEGERIGDSFGVDGLNGSPVILRWQQPVTQELRH